MVTAWCWWRKFLSMHRWLFWWHAHHVVRIWEGAQENALYCTARDHWESCRRPCHSFPGFSQWHEIIVQRVPAQLFFPSQIVWELLLIPWLNTVSALDHTEEQGFFCSLTLAHEYMNTESFFFWSLALALTLAHLYISSRLFSAISGPFFHFWGAAIIMARQKNTQISFFNTV